MESGKGKCSYDPKLNSVSALISEYHLASGCRLGPALPLVPTAPLPACFFSLSTSFYLWRLSFFAKCFQHHGPLSLITVSCLLIYGCVFSMESQTGDGTPAGSILSHFMQEVAESTIKNKRPESVILNILPQQDCGRLWMRS